MEAETTACWAFKTFFQLLGLSMKPEKEQPPAPRQKVLGVIVSVNDHDITVEICPQRRARLLTSLEEVLASNRLTPDEAQRLAGKLGFMATTLFGGMGMAAIQPFYARAHCLGAPGHHNLTFGLRAAIKILQQILQDSRPRTFNWNHDDDNPMAVIYSDAFFQLGERMLRPKEPPEQWNPRRRRPKSNRWGFIVRLPSRVVFAHGTLPDEFIQKFTTRRAFIYMMEILAAVIAVTYTREVLPPYFTMFIDNQAGKAALARGYGSDARVNAIITAFWTLVSHERWYPDFKYVKSDHNVSDRISRHDTGFAIELGWEELQIDITQMLQELEKFASDPGGSINDLLSGLLSLLGTPRRVGDVQGVVGNAQPPASPCWSKANQPAEGERKDSEIAVTDASMESTCRAAPG